MLLRKKGLVLPSVLALAATFLFGSALEARSPIVGQVTLTQAATLDGQPVKAQTTVFSGDTLAVGEGVAVLVFGSGNQVRLGSDTVANFAKEGDSIAVHLEKGIVSISSTKGASVKVTAFGVEIAPAEGFKTIGHIAMLGATPGSLSVTAREGSLKISQPGSSPVTVRNGGTITVKTQTAAGAPAPQGASSGGSSGLMVGIAAGASLGAFIIAISAAVKAGDAKEEVIDAVATANASATTAGTKADAATAQALLATTAATTAGTKADAATAQALLATTAATTAGTKADAVGTELNELIADICSHGHSVASPGAAATACN